MPLIVICGIPNSGKSYRAHELKQFLTKKGKHVEIISENVTGPKAGFKKNELFTDQKKEKLIRADLKSQVLRLLDKEKVTIMDAGNYIKGYRYEIFCATKAANTTQCTLFCAIQNEEAWKNNCQKNDTEDNIDKSVNLTNNSNIPYSRQVFDELCFRFEEPQSNCRWDSPLFVCFPNETLDTEEIFKALFETKALLPNKSTQNPPLCATNYLFELDKITQQIIKEIISYKKIGMVGNISIAGCETKVSIPNHVNLIKLNQLRRQFLNYNKMHTASNTIDKIPQLFIQFLNSNLINT